jgi:endoribonuclease Nob1
MNQQTKLKVYILDTSAILSGKPMNFENIKMITTPKIRDEIQPGGRDYRIFEFLIEKGLNIQIPSYKAIKKIDEISSKTGDIYRLSDADKEILAIALDINNDKEKEAVIITDDYSIQNTASEIGLKFENIAQNGITKKLKWGIICTGCGKKFKENINVCLICGSHTKKIVISGRKIKK